MTDAAARACLAAAWRAGIAAAHGETVLRRDSWLEGDQWVLALQGRECRVPLPPRGGAGRLRLVGAGKAVASLARGAESVLGDRLDDGLVVVKHGHAEALERCRSLEAGHPWPDVASARAAGEVLEFVSRSSPEDLYVVLLTGGASALLAGAAPGLTLGDKIAFTKALVRSGATIQQINAVRRHLSTVKGGRLARALYPARSVTLAISDVPGDDPATIGSGPTVADPSSFADALRILDVHAPLEPVPPAVRAHLEAGARGEVQETPKPGDPVFERSGFVLVATLRDALEAAAAAARAAGCDVVSWPAPLVGDAHATAREFASRLRELASGRRAGAPPLVLVAGGETTLQVRGGGQGGRCQEMAVVAAVELAGARGLTLLAAGTDGTDGPTDAAGGYADGATLARIRRAGLDPVARLADNDCHRLLEAAGDLYVSGPTGTNVTDLLLGIAVTAGGSPRAGRLA